MLNTDYNHTQAELDNYANTLNPNNIAYKKSRMNNTPPQPKKPRPHNGPSTTGNPSGKGRGNNPPGTKKK